MKKTNKKERNGKKKFRHLTLTEQVNRRKVELIVYAAFIMGFQARNEGRSLENLANFEEIHNLIKLITKEIR